MVWSIVGLILLLFAALALLGGAVPWLGYLHGVLGLACLSYGLYTGFAELRGAVASRGARRGGNALVQSVAVVVILAAIGFLSVRYDKQWDWTEAEMHTLTTATRDVLKQIPAEQSVEIYAFFVKGSEGEARGNLESYAYANERVNFRVIDPNRRPELAQQFEIRSNGVVLVCAGACETAKASARVVEVNEEELTKAIRSVISEQRKVYFLTGHGEGAPDDPEAAGYLRAAEALQAENLIVEPLLLANLPEVPDDADAVIIAGPTHSVLARELDALDSYLRGGGSIAVLADPLLITNLEGRVRDWGIELGNDVLIDETVDLFRGPQLGVLAIGVEYAEHPITDELGANALTQFRLARSVGAAGDAEIVELVRTGPQSWAETDLALYTGEGKVGLHPEDDRTGPIGLAAARTLPGNGEREGRLVVVGDADFGRNQFVSRVYNVDFFLNIANWLVHEEQFITIDRKRPRISLAEMTRTQVATFQYVSIFFLPEAILLLGVAIWWRRRS